LLKRLGKAFDRYFDNDEFVDAEPPIAVTELSEFNSALGDPISATSANGGRNIRPAVQRLIPGV